MAAESLRNRTTAGIRLRAALASGAERLNRAGIDTAFLDAELLLGHATALMRAQLLSSPDRALTGAQAERFEDALRRRLDREPVAYITGHREFWSLDFHVAPEVLIPRPETERLVEIALELIENSQPSGVLRILEIGTGSGAIAVSLAKELLLAEICATDISAPALAIARGNAARHQVSERIRLQSGDLFEPVALEKGSFSLIVCNPPYVCSAAIAGLPPEVGRWEPRTALDGGADGMDFYRRIGREAWAYLAPGGAIALEVGAGMGAAVAGIFGETGRYAAAQVRPDYAGRDRVVAAHALRLDEIRE